jgi:hypothetical protein
MEPHGLFISKSGDVVMAREQSDQRWLGGCSQVIVATITIAIDEKGGSHPLVLGLVQFAKNFWISTL